MAFDIKNDTIGGIPALRLSGVLADTDVYRFSRELKAAARLGPPRIIVDVSKLDYIDSHGLGLLVFHYTNFQKENRVLTILNENPGPESYMSGLLRTTGLTNVLRIDTARTLTRNGC